MNHPVPTGVESRVICPYMVIRSRIEGGVPHAYDQDEEPSESLFDGTDHDGGGEEDLPERGTL